MTIQFGENIKVELYGTSHGPCVGVRIEGLPAGREIDCEKLQTFLDRRAPGRNAWSTPRREADRPVFLSGVKQIENANASSAKIAADILVTTGEPLVAEIRNTNTRPQDYQQTSMVPRPGHADYPAFAKYGRIESGGGQFSARLTAALCIAGGIFLQWLEEEGITVCAHISSIGGIEDEAFDPMGCARPSGSMNCKKTSGSIGCAMGCDKAVQDEVQGADEFPVIDREKGEAMKALIAEVKAAGDSIGGSIECMICGLPVGVGEPLFGSIEGRICQAVFTVPAVKGIEFGAGFDVARMRGSENNDPFVIEEMGDMEPTAPGRTVEAVPAFAEDKAPGHIGDNGSFTAASNHAAGREVRTATNHHGGILGGLSSGMPVLFRVAMKPTPSIAIQQQSVDLMSMRSTTLQIKGRHDPCIVPRAVPCIEAAAALAIFDLLSN